MPFWDYGSYGLYFVTICTKNRTHYFGHISEQQNNETQNIAFLQKTAIGEIAYRNWLTIHDHFPFIELDEFVVMSITFMEFFLLINPIKSIGK